MKLKKFLAIIASLSLLFASSGFLFKNEAFAQDAGTKTENVEVVCQKLARNNRNELEIPIGKAVDQAEYLADQVIAQAQVIIATTQQQIDAANALSGLANQCGHEYCVPDCRVVISCGACHCRGCEAQYGLDALGSAVYLYTDPECSCGSCTGTGNCGLDGDGIARICCCPTGGRAPYLTDQCHANEIRAPSGSCSGCQDSRSCCEGIVSCTAYPCRNGGNGVADLRDRACALGIPGAASTVNALYLSIVSTHDRLVHYDGHYASDVIPFLREAKPKLENCKPPTTDSDFEAVMKGEKQGEWLYSCTQIINMTELGVPIHSYLPFWNGSEVEFPDEPERGCYGNDYCKHLESIGENLPYGQPSCAEDYYCCIIGE